MAREYATGRVAPPAAYHGAGDHGRRGVPPLVRRHHRGLMMQPISPEVAYRALEGHPGWVVERHRLYRDFRLGSFIEAIALVNRVAEVAERAGHHPNILVHEWCFVRVELYSHLADALSDLDVELALAIDASLNETS
jgi:4a-hydroxytetrahydrobiopterin dehydratase